MDNKKKTKIVLIIGSIILVCLALFTTTYSAFYNEQSASNIEDYSTGLLSIEAKSKNDVIVLNKAIPKSDTDGGASDPYVFTIKNNGNVDYNFDIKLLSTSSSNTISTQYIKIKVDDGNPAALSSLTNSIIKSNITLGAKESVDITLRVWLDINTPNSQIGKTFTSKIVTEGQAVYTTSNYDAYDSLPEGYQRLEYIESTGTQYINTEYVDSNPNTRFQIDFEYLGSGQTAWTPICGLRGNGNSTYYNFFINETNLKISPNYAGWDPGGQGFPILSKNKRYLIENNAGTYYIDGQSYTYTENILETSTTPFYIFAIGSGTGYDHRGTKLKLYSFKLYEVNTIVRDMIPCYRELDHEIGLYDNANNIFYENAGTGDFIEGPEV